MLCGHVMESLGSIYNLFQDQQDCILSPMISPHDITDILLFDKILNLAPIPPAAVRLLSSPAVKCGRSNFALHTHTHPHSVTHTHTCTRHSDAAGCNVEFTWD